MITMDWEIEERMPKYDDLREYEVWTGRCVRRVRRIGRVPLHFGPTPLIAAMRAFVAHKLGEEVDL